MMMFDWRVWKKTVKVVMQMIVMAVVTCVLVLLVTSFCQQRVYNNVGMNRNAYVEVFEHLVGR